MKKLILMAGLLVLVACGERPGADTGAGAAGAMKDTAMMSSDSAMMRDSMMMGDTMPK